MNVNTSSSAFSSSSASISSSLSSSPSSPSNASDHSSSLSSLSSPTTDRILCSNALCWPVNWYGGRIPSTTSSSSPYSTSGNACVRQMYRMISSHHPLYLTIV